MQWLCMTISKACLWYYFTGQRVIGLCSGCVWLYLKPVCDIISGQRVIGYAVAVYDYDCLKPVCDIISGQRVIVYAMAVYDYI